MKFITGDERKKTVELRELMDQAMEGRSVTVNGAVHTIRDMGEVIFVILRKSAGLVQCVCEAGRMGSDIRALKEESTVEVDGIVMGEERAPHGFEIHLSKIRVLSEPFEVLPLAVSKWKLKTSLETKLSLRPISLRRESSEDFASFCLCRDLLR